MTTETASDSADLALQHNSASAQNIAATTTDTQSSLTSKPLPDIPPPLCPPPEALPARQQTLSLADSWWPSRLPSFAVQSEEPPTADSPELDEACTTHLRTLLQSCLQSTKGTLPVVFEDSAYDAVMQALETLTGTSLLSFIQRNESLRWRLQAESCGPRRAGNTSRSNTLSRWPQTGWMADAHKGISAPGAALADAVMQLARSADLSSSSTPSKADVAFAILGNAIELMSPSAVDETVPDARARGLENPRPEKPFRRGALPTFLPPSTPTIALSGATSPNPVPADTSAPPSGLRPPLLKSPSTQSLQSIESLPDMRQTAETSSSEAFARDASALHKPSKAMEQLASFGVISGAALKEGAATGASADTGVLDSSPTCSSSSIGRQEAEAVTVTPLAAGNDVLGAKCEDFAKIILAQVSIVRQIDSKMELHAHECYSGFASSGTSTNTARSSDRGTVKPESNRTLTDQNFRRPIRWKPDDFEGRSLFGCRVPSAPDGPDNSAKMKRVGGAFHVMARSRDEADLMEFSLATSLFLAISLRLDSAVLRDLGCERPVPLNIDHEPASADSSPESHHRHDSSLTASPPQAEAKELPRSETRAKHQPKAWSKGLWDFFQPTSDVSLPAQPDAKEDRQQSSSLYRHHVESAKSRRGGSSDVPFKFGSDSRGSSPPSSGRFAKLFGKGNLLNRHRDRAPSSPPRIPGEPESPTAITSPTQDETLSALKEHRMTKSLPVIDDIPPLSELLHKPAPPLSVSPEISQVLAKRLHSDPMPVGSSYIRAFAEMQGASFLITDEIIASGRKDIFAEPTKSRDSYFAALSPSSVLLRAGFGASTSPQPIFEAPSIPTSPLMKPFGTTKKRGPAVKEYYKNDIAGKSQGKSESDNYLGQILEMLFSKSMSSPPPVEKTEPLIPAIRFLQGRWQATLTVSSSVAATSELIPAASEVDAVLRALPISRETAQVVLQFADDVLERAQGSSSERAEDGTIWIWSASVRSGEQSMPRQLTPASWLLPFGRFIEAITHNPWIANNLADGAISDQVWLFKRGASLAKVSVSPIVLHELETEGPVVYLSKANEGGPLGHGHTEFASRKCVGSLVADIDAVYGSVKNELSRLRDACQHEDKSAGDAVSTDTDAASLVSSKEDLLGELQAVLESEECELRDTAASPRQHEVNDIRRALKRAYQSTHARLDACRREHFPGIANRPHQDEPDWMRAGRHAFPGSCYILREDEPLSIIAFSLSSKDYLSELSGRGSPDHRDGFDSDVKGPQKRQSSQEKRSKSPPCKSIAHLEGKALKDETDPVNMTVKRKQRNRDGSILSLTLRRVGSGLSAGSDVAGGDGDLGDESFDSEDFDITQDDIDGQRSVLTAADGTLGSKRRMPSHSGTISTIGTGDSRSTFRASISQVTGRIPSIASVTHGSSRDSAVGMGISETPTTSASANGDKGTRKRSTSPRRPSVAESSGFAASSRTWLSAVDPTASYRRSSATKQSRAESTSPHIKQTITHGKSKISCVSWFAEAFAKLRAQWGVEEDFAESLSRCTPWQATGGKSKSHFFRSTDSKWIGKELLTIWSVDEIDALLEFAPAYCRYMMNSYVNDCPTLLVKIAGFYSLKIKDTKSGEIKLRMSVMILENIFADPASAKAARFDLKGIKDRRAVKTQPSNSTSHAESAAATEGGHAAVGWDADWIEQFQPTAFVPERQKDHFIRALRNDLAFLTECNVMDFSLLVGVIPSSTSSPASPDGTEASQQSKIRVRIVDYISAFTLAKQLESSSKKALKSSAEARGNVTVLPPQEYASRFQKAMIEYFVGVPDWRPNQEEFERIVRESEEMARKGVALDKSKIKIPWVN